MFNEAPPGAEAVTLIGASSKSDHCQIAPLVPKQAQINGVVTKAQTLQLFLVPKQLQNLLSRNFPGA